MPHRNDMETSEVARSSQRYQHEKKRRDRHQQGIPHALWPCQTTCDWKRTYSGRFVRLLCHLNLHLHVFDPETRRDNQMEWQVRPTFIIQSCSQSLSRSRCLIDGLYGFICGFLAIYSGLTTDKKTFLGIDKDDFSSTLGKGCQTLDPVVDRIVTCHLFRVPGIQSSSEWIDPNNLNYICWES